MFDFTRINDDQVKAITATDGPVLVIAGPTASGKTGFSLEIARETGWSVISGDSIQVYRGMDIGSGKVTAEEMGYVTH